MRDTYGREMCNTKFLKCVNCMLCCLKNPNGYQNRILTAMLKICLFSDTELTINKKQKICTMNISLLL